MGSMPKLYLLGGENVSQRSAKEINQRAFEDAGATPNVLIFPWARPGFDKIYRRRKLVTDYFRSLGADSVEFIEYQETEEIADKIAASDLIYLTGGQASILIERTKTMHLDSQLKNYRGIIVGRSAGALALCKRCVTTCRSNGRVRVVNGLGLADITLKAHYRMENDETLKRFSLKETIFAVPKDSVLIYENRKLCAIGEVYLFNGGQRHVFSESDL
jgi:dipeptidase E